MTDHDTECIHGVEEAWCNICQEAARRKRAFLEQPRTSSGKTIKRGRESARDH